MARRPGSKMSSKIIRSGGGGRVATGGFKSRGAKKPINVTTASKKAAKASKPKGKSTGKSFIGGKIVPTKSVKGSDVSKSEQVMKAEAKKFENEMKRITKGRGK